MATVRAYSVCQSEGGTAQRSRSVYSYAPGFDLQDGSTLTPNGTPAADAYRTGLSPAYCHGGAATADADAVGYANTGGLTPTLIAGQIGTVASTFPAGTGPATGVTLAAAGTGNAALANCARVVCSTTNIGAPDADSVEGGAGLLVAVSTNANGVPTLLGTPIISAGNGYDTGTDDTVALDGFPGSQVTVAA